VGTDNATKRRRFASRDRCPVSAAFEIATKAY